MPNSFTSRECEKITPEREPVHFDNEMSLFTKDFTRRRIWAGQSNVDTLSDNSLKRESILIINVVLGLLIKKITSYAELIRERFSSLGSKHLWVLFASGVYKENKTN